jgi:hypothetical protein
MLSASHSTLRNFAAIVLWGAMASCVMSCSSRSDTDHLPSGAKSQVDRQYLNSAVNKASEDNVASTLGFPSEKHNLNDGGSVWTYRYKYQRTHLIFGHRSLCTEVVLAFDNGKKLQELSQQGCPEESRPASQ